MNKKSLRGTEEDCRCRDISYIWLYREVSVLLSSVRQKFRTTKFQYHLFLFVSQILSVIYSYIF